MDVASVTLPADAPLKRVPVRPPEFQGEGFAEKFDFDTLIYDAVLSPDRASVRLICPSLLNLKSEIEKSVFRALPKGSACRFRIRKLDRHDQIIIEIPPGTLSLSLESPLGTFAIRFSEEASALFADERVAFTLSRNNKLEWIQDWARFYRDVHGATAILIYDNSSTDYTAEALLDALQKVAGLNRVVIVRWPFRHGPPGHGTKRYWDSNFSQLGAFEDARWRFLQQARSVVNCDIDELVVAKNGASVFEQVERSKMGVAAYYGDWVFGIEGVTRSAEKGRPLRFLDYRHVMASIRTLKFGFLPSYPMRCKSKWAAVPSRCPPRAQWHIHTINGWPAARVIWRNFRFRHFREISVSWKYDRTERDVLDPKRHREDPMMAAAFARVDWTR